MTPCHTSLLQGVRHLWTSRPSYSRTSQVGRLLRAPQRRPSRPEGRLAVQVGAFATSLAAEELAKSLRSKGYAASVSPGATAGESRWRVRVGPLATRDEAEATAARLKKAEKLPTWILSEDAG